MMILNIVCAGGKNENKNTVIDNVKSYRWVKKGAFKWYTFTYTFLEIMLSNHVGKKWFNPD